MAGPSSDSLTFLLTDIEGSTALWERLPETMQAALSRHDGILQALVTHHRGHPFKSTGDGIFAAFAEARAALDAALAIQHVVRTTSWGQLGTLRLRVALHTGPAQYRDGDYFGQTVNRVSRLLAIAEGGQILASESVLAGLEGDLPAGVAIRSIGDVPLRDVPDPLRVYVVEAVQGPGAESGSPPASPTAPDAAAAGASSPAPAPGLRVYTLGEFRVQHGDREIAADGWGGSQARQIFKYLVSRRTRRVARDDLYEQFFPDSADAAASTMRSTVYRLRRILEPDTEHADSIIVVSRDGIGLRRETPLWVDAEAFERLLADARRADDPLPLLEQADALYQGDYLPDDSAEEWVGPRREALRQLWIDLQLDLARAREQQGRVDDAAGALLRVLGADPCDERIARELMLLLARHGRRADALRVFQRLADALRADLDVAPSPEAEDVRARIVAGEIAPADVPRSPAASQPAAGQPQPLPDRLPVAAEPPPSASPPLTGYPQPAHQPPPEPAGRPFAPSYPFPTPELLVGRQREILTLRRAVDRGRTSGQVALIGAPAGSGKSALTGALLEYARGKGFLTLAGGSYDREGIVPFGPIRDALADYLLSQSPEALRHDLGALARDLVRVVPELGVHLQLPDDPAAEAIDAGRLFAVVHGCLRVLTARQPVVLCLEDLHAADGATLSLLHFLTRQTRREPLVLVCTYRTDEIQAGQPLARVLATMTRERIAEQLSLAPLDRDETADLVTALLNGPPSADLSRAVYATSEGNPLFVEQLVLSLQEDGRLHWRGAAWRHDGDDDTRLRPIIREVIERRFARLSSHCREVLEVASVIGLTFDHPLLVAAQRQPDDEAVSNDLDEAIRAQVVQETANGYTFGHAMLREALYRSMSGALRGRLHARVGLAMERLAGPRAAERAAELAHHFALAADTAATSEQALRYSLEAGRRAVALSANREALAHYTRACDLVERAGDAATGEAPAAEARIEALAGRAWVERQLGMWLACIASCQTILELSADPVRRAWMRSAICRALRALGDTERSLVEAEAGLAELAETTETPDVARIRIRLLYDRAFLYHLAGRFRQVEAVGREMVAIAERHGLTASQHLPYATLALACMHQGRDAETVEYYRLAIPAAEQTRDLIGQAVIRENLGKQHHLAGRFATAIPDLERAVELYDDAAAGSRSVNALHRLARIKLSQGEVDAAEQQANLALSRAVDGQDRWAAECHDLLGAIHAVRSSWVAAEESYERALAIRERVKHVDGIVESLLGLATVAERRGEWPRAEPLARRALDVARSLDPCPDQVGPARLLGRIYGRRGDPTRAAEFLDMAAGLVETMAPTIELTPTLLALAEEQQRSGDPTSAALVERALGAVASAEPTGEAHVVAAEIACANGDLVTARRHVDAAMQLARRMGAPRLLGLAQLAAARLHAAAGESAPAQEAFEAARQALEDAAVPYELAIATRDYGRFLVRQRGREERGRALLASARMRFEQLGAMPDTAACLRALADAGRP